MFANQPPDVSVRELRQKPGKDIGLMGGGELAHAFLQADAVDQLHLGIVPVLLGEGIPLFPAGFPQRDFTLTENQTFSRGLIALKYARVRLTGKAPAPRQASSETPSKKTRSRKR